MKSILTIVFVLSLLHGKDRLANSTWIYKISNSCIDTLKFKPNRQISDRDCEMNYTFHGSYTISNDTVFVILKDDSHSEDNGKVSYWRTKYLIKNKALYVIESWVLENGKWEKRKIHLNTNPDYVRIK